MRLRNRGFTLLEMAVVLAILLILAGLILARLDVFEMKANKAVSAVNMGNIGELVQTYRSTTSTYPDGWDSLLMTSGSGLVLAQAGVPVAVGSPGFMPGVHPELTGGPPFNATNGPVQLVAKDLVGQEAQSLGRLFIDTLYDFPSNATLGNWPVLPGDADIGVAARHLSASGAAQTVAFLNYGTGTSGSGDPSFKANEVVGYIYPNQIQAGKKAADPTTIPPAGKDLVVFGLGPRNTMIGAGSLNALLTDAPFYPNENQLQYYNRYLVVFEVSQDGSRARQVAVLGSDGDPLRDEVQDYYSAQ